MKYLILISLVGCVEQTKYVFPPQITDNHLTRIENYCTKRKSLNEEYVKCECITEASYYEKLNDGSEVRKQVVSVKAEKLEVCDF